MTDSPLTAAEIAGIRERAEKATAGPWEWERSYEIGSDYDDGKHWALHNPEDRDQGMGDGAPRVTNPHLVTWTTCPTDYDDVPLDHTPDFQFIAHARSDIPRLLADRSRLVEELERVRNDASRWQAIRPHLLFTNRPWPLLAARGDHSAEVLFRLGCLQVRGDHPSLESAVDALVESAILASQEPEQ